MQLFLLISSLFGPNILLGALIIFIIIIIIISNADICKAIERLKTAKFAGLDSSSSWLHEVN
jgi:hypothetical protein